MDASTLRSTLFKVPQRRAGGHVSRYLEARGLEGPQGYSVGRNNMVGFSITHARDRDGPCLQIDESWRVLGLIDLGYASLDLLRQCRKYGVSVVLRLKNGWKPRQLRFIDEDDELVESVGEPVLSDLLAATRSPARQRHGSTS